MREGERQGVLQLLSWTAAAVTAGTTPRPVCPDIRAYIAAALRRRAALAGGEPVRARGEVDLSRASVAFARANRRIIHLIIDLGTTYRESIALSPPRASALLAHSVAEGTCWAVADAATSSSTAAARKIEERAILCVVCGVVR